MREAFVSILHFHMFLVIQIRLLDGFLLHAFEFHVASCLTRVLLYEFTLGSSSIFFRSDQSTELQA